MPGFYGKHYYSLDPKGRVIIPAPFREILSSNYNLKLIFVNDAFDRCVCAYPVDEWNRLMEKIKEKPQTLEAVRYYMRRVVGSAVECEIDKQGRVLIPQSLREDAGLNNEIVLVGQNNRVELWDKKEFDGVADPSKVDRKAMMAELSSLGL
ncbi:MAG: division/cell wall cluster transcriptional repressor MraZ [Nitrospirae bacterium]|nr:division/cell wall cluster transcriptional repressor MraZ [Nitrospirota bacterium]